MVEQTSVPKSRAKRFFTSVAAYVLALFMLFMGFVGVCIAGWVLQTLFPQFRNKPLRSRAHAVAVPADIQAYFEAVGKQVDASGASLGAIMQLSGDASAKPSIVATPDWQKKAAAACAALRSEGKALQNIAPVPSDCLSMNADVRRAGARYVEIAQDYAEGVDIRHLDKSAVLRAAKATHIVLEQDDKTMVDDAARIKAKYRN